MLMGLACKAEVIRTVRGGVRVRGLRCGSVSRTNDQGVKNPAEGRLLGLIGIRETRSSQDVEVMGLEEGRLA